MSLNALLRKACACAAALVLAVLVGCGAQQTPEATDQPQDTGVEAEAGTGDVGGALEDGTYEIEVTTDSSMFRAESCLLTVDGDTYTAQLSLPGEGFSRLYFGSAEDAAAADDADIYDYYLNDDGLYTFDIAVEALDEELPVAAYGQRRDTWYDHTIEFESPSDAEEADAA